jgi:hypothetical protein
LRVQRADYGRRAAGPALPGAESKMVEGVPVQQEVTHGNAYGIYFFDPEGNRGEVYLRIDRDVRQPFRKSLNLEQSVEAVNAEAERLLSDGGPAYQPVAWTRSPTPPRVRHRTPSAPGKSRTIPNGLCLLWIANRPPRGGNQHIDTFRQRRPGASIP